MVSWSCPLQLLPEQGVVYCVHRRQPVDAEIYSPLYLETWLPEMNKTMQCKKRSCISTIMLTKLVEENRLDEMLC